MAWNDAPPTKAELATPSVHDWTKDAPTDDELGHTSYSKLDSLLRGGANQLGLAPAIVGAAQHPIEAAEKASNPLLRLLGAKEFSNEDTAGYDKERAESNQHFKDAEAQNPWSYGAGNIAGSIPLMALAPETAPGILGGAKIGAGLAAATAVGRGLSDDQGVGDIAKSAGIQGTIGGITGGVVGGIANKLLPSNLDEAAANNAIESLRPNQSTITKIMQSTPKTPGGDRTTEVGQLLIKPTEFLGGKSIVTAGASPKVILSNVEAAQAAAGKYVGEMADKLDASGEKLVTTRGLQEKIEDILKNKYTIPQDAAQQEFAGMSLEGGEEAYNALNGLKNNILKTVGTNKDEPISFGTAKKILQWIDDGAYNKAGNIANKDLNNLRGMFNNEIESHLDTAANSIGDPAAAAKFLHAKDLYRATKQIEKAADTSVAKEITHADLGLLDYAAGGIGLHALGGPGAIAAVAAKKFLVKNWNSSAAQAQQSVSDGIRAMSAVLTKANTETLVNWGNKAQASADPTMQSLGRVLSKMAEKDGTGRNAVVFSLMQNPAYREILRTISGN